MDFESALRDIHTTCGHSLLQLSMVKPQLVVLLRHSGCTFCRQALADLARHKDELRRVGVELVLVHQGDPDSAAKWFAEYGLGDARQISDPQTKLYQVFELGKASVLDLLKPSVWWHGLRAAIFQRHWFGKIVGDVFQMPGVFLLDQGKIVRSFRHKLASDRPNYLELACPMNASE